MPKRHVRLKDRSNADSTGHSQIPGTTSPSRRYGLLANVLLALGATAFPTTCTISLAFDHVHFAIWSGVAIMVTLTGWVACSVIQHSDPPGNHAFALKIIAVGLCVAIITGGVVELITWRNRNRIALSIGFILSGDDRETSGALWLARKDYIAPVNAAILVRIRNLTGSPVGIDKFECLLKDAAGTWRELLFMHAAGQLYCCTGDKTGLNSMHRLELDGGGLFRILENGPVPSHGQVTNWLIFEYPRGFQPNREAYQLKLALWDHAGLEYTAEAGSPNQQKPLTTSEGKPQFHPAVQEELDRLMMKTIFNPPLNLAVYRVAHVYDELSIVPDR